MIHGCMNMDYVVCLAALLIVLLSDMISIPCVTGFPNLQKEENTLTTSQIYVMRFGEPSDQSPHRRVKRSGAKCPRKCMPVCGKNDRSYCNLCHAQCLDIPIATHEPCKTWLYLETDKCAMCSARYQPVCACDRTYYNSCVARCMNIDDFTDGVCM